MTNPLDKLPRDIRAEQAVLGSLMLDRDAVIKVTPYLRPSDFYLERYGEVYGAVLRLYERREPADLVLLCSELESKGKLDDVGGMAGLLALVDETSTATHIEYYANIVVDKAYRRSIITAGGAIAADAYMEDIDLDSLIAKSERILQDATMRRGNSGIVTLSDAIAEYSERVDLLEDGGNVAVGVPSGFPSLDNKTGGWQRGKLVIHAGRPGSGKTSLVLNEMKAAAVADITPGIFSLEMDREELVHRFIADEARVSSQKLITKRYLNQDERGRVSRAEGVLSRLTACIDDTANLSISELRSKAFRMKAEYGIGILFVDYLQLVTAQRKDNNRVLEVGEVARKLKILARELDLPVIAGAQLSRAVESRQSHIPMLSDLRDSGEIEQHADIVIFLHREEMYGETSLNSGMAELHIAKHRAGPLGVVPLRFVKELTQFQPLAQFGGGAYADEV